MVFARAFQIEKVSEEGFSTPTLRATWQLHFPECYSSIIVTFLDPSNEVVGEATITENITITTEVTQMVSVCNERVRAIFKASDGFTIVEQRSPRRVYAGGKFAPRIFSCYDLGILTIFFVCCNFATCY